MARNETHKQCGKSSDKINGSGACPNKACQKHGREKTRAGRVHLKGKEFDSAIPWGGRGMVYRGADVHKCLMGDKIGQWMWMGFWILTREGLYHYERMIPGGFAPTKKEAVRMAQEYVDQTCEINGWCQLLTALPANPS